MAIFSFTAFVITMRETMEAALIIGILLAYLTKTKNDKFKRDIWLGASLAIVLSLVGAVLFQALLGGLEGDSEKLFEGIVMISAAAVLTWMIVWMFYNARTLKYQLEEKTQIAISENRKFAFVSLAFIAVFREGIETVLFLTSISTNESIASVSLGATSGIFVATLLAALLFRGTVELNIKQFFNVTSIILIVFAAGLFANGIYEFQELGWFGSETANQNQPVWDWSATLNDKDNSWGALMRALFGYQDKPTPIEIVAYVFYWIAITMTFMKINREQQQTTQAVSA